MIAVVADERATLDFVLTAEPVDGRLWSASAIATQVASSALSTAKSAAVWFSKMRALAAA